jgi:hypothetical protein
MKKEIIYYMAACIMYLTSFLLFLSNHPVIGLFVAAIACFLLLRASYEDFDNIQY